MNVKTCLYSCCDTSGKNTLFFRFLSKRAKIHVWNKRKLYKKAPISTRIFSAIKSNEQHLNCSQCKR